MRFKAALITLLILVLVSSGFARVQVEVDTDKEVYVPGETVYVSVYLAPYGVASEDFYDVNLYLKNNDTGNLISYNSGLYRLNTDIHFDGSSVECSKAGSYLNTEGNYYGWWMFGTIPDTPFTLSTSTKLFTVSAKVNSLTLAQRTSKGIAGNTAQVKIEPLVRSITGYSGVNKITLASSTMPPHISKDITIRFTCALDSDCGTKNFCVNNFCEEGGVGSNCLNSQDCQTGNYCVASKCQSGLVGSLCDGTDATCDLGFFCVSLDGVVTCQTGSEGAPCVDISDCDVQTPPLGCRVNKCSLAPVEPCSDPLADPNDCDGDLVIKSKDKCPNTPKNTNIFKETDIGFDQFWGCMKGDMDKNDVVTDADLSLYIIDYKTYVNQQLSAEKASDLEYINTPKLLVDGDTSMFIVNYKYNVNKI
ncbi:MAG: hypothetical protein WCV90_02060 [Candidatus Woesearchaeota archaeon]